jgi:phytoene synthase
MKFQIGRARALYAEAVKGIPLLEPDSRFTVLLAARLYGRILNEIEKNNCDVFTRRAHLTLPAKIRAVPKIWFAAKRI